MSPDPAREGWHCISDGDLLKPLRRAHAGEDPDLVLTELYANSEADGRGK